MQRAGRLSNHISIPVELRYFFLFQSTPNRSETQQKKFYSVGTEGCFSLSKAAET